jgi:hypothetical protein
LERRQVSVLQKDRPRPVRLEMVSEVNLHHHPLVLPLRDQAVPLGLGALHWVGQVPLVLRQEERLPHLALVERPENLPRLVLVQKIQVETHLADRPAALAQDLV